MPKFFTRAFWTQTAEYAAVAAASTFAGSQLFTTPPSAKSFAAAGIAAGMAALYSVVSQIGGVKVAKAAAASKPTA